MGHFYRTCKSTMPLYTYRVRKYVENGEFEAKQLPEGMNKWNYKLLIETKDLADKFYELTSVGTLLVKLIALIGDDDISKHSVSAIYNLIKAQKGTNRYFYGVQRPAIMKYKITSEKLYAAIAKHNKISYERYERNKALYKETIKNIGFDSFCEFLEADKGHDIYEEARLFRESYNFSVDMKYGLSTDNVTIEQKVAFDKFYNDFLKYLEGYAKENNVILLEDKTEEYKKHIAYREKIIADIEEGKRRDRYAAKVRIADKLIDIDMADINQLIRTGGVSTDSTIHVRSAYLYSHLISKLKDIGGKGYYISKCYGREGSRVYHLNVDGSKFTESKVRFKLFSSREEAEKEVKKWSDDEHNVYRVMSVYLSEAI